MIEEWKKHDRPCPPCPKCGTELYEKFWGNGGWVVSDRSTEETHWDGDCVERLRRILREVVAAQDIVDDKRPNWTEDDMARLHKAFEVAKAVLFTGK